jgi:hypothetical protein
MKFLTEICSGIFIFTKNIDDFNLIKKKNLQQNKGTLTTVNKIVIFIEIFFNFQPCIGRSQQVEKIIYRPMHGKVFINENFNRNM